MVDRAGHILNTVFGYESFRDKQEAIIEHVIAGRDALVIMPTGGGKSLCYQIPALIRSGVGLVVSPLIALMQDQVDSLCQMGVRAAFLNSSQDPSQQAQVERCLRAGDLDLLYVAPERLTTPGFLSLLDETPLALFAIDEAHCVFPSRIPPAGYLTRTFSKDPAHRPHSHGRYDDSRGYLKTS
jgi:ATP-dependent DNA helicase RecQ